MRFLLQGHNGAIPFADVFLNEDKNFDKRINAIEIPKLPRAFINNIGEMSAIDVAFIVFNQFFGENVDPTLIRELTTKCLTSLITKSATINKPDIVNKYDYNLYDVTAAIINGLNNYYIQAGRLSPSANNVIYGPVHFLQSAYQYIGQDSLLITNTGETFITKPQIPVFAIKGDNLTLDGLLVANAINKLNATGRRAILFTINNVAALLAYVFIVIEKIRQFIAEENTYVRYAVKADSDNYLLYEAIKIVNSLGFEVDAVSSQAATDNNCPTAHTLTITINYKSNFQPKSAKSPIENITRIAPSVSVIKQLIL